MVGDSNTENSRVTKTFLSPGESSGRAQQAGERAGEARMMTDRFACESQLTQVMDLTGILIR
jgi:hypothetical protein